MPQPTTGSTPGEPERDAGSMRSQTDTGKRPAGPESGTDGGPETGTAVGTETGAERAGEARRVQAQDRTPDTPDAEAAEARTTAVPGRRRASVPEQPTAPAPEQTAGTAGQATTDDTPTTAVPAAETPTAAVPAPATVMTPAHLAARPHWIWGLTRVALGWVFLWAFLDKLFGFGFTTSSDRAWLNGGSPTQGYLTGVDGPFRSFFNPMAGAPWADWLFMVGLAGIGLALMLGIGVRIAAVAGTALLVMMWMASWPIAANPFLDEHLVYALVLIGLAIVNAGDTVGFGRLWSRTALVRAMPVLR
jgi:thiosulfate dehydrogenase [quinone] large subunit